MLLIALAKTLKLISKSCSFEIGAFSDHCTHYSEHCQTSLVCACSSPGPAIHQASRGGHHQGAQAEVVSQHCLQHSVIHIGRVLFIFPESSRCLLHLVSVPSHHGRHAQIQSTPQRPASQAVSRHEALQHHLSSDCPHRCRYCVDTV